MNPHNKTDYDVDDNTSQVTTANAQVQASTTLDVTTKTITCKKGAYKPDECKNSDVLYDGGMQLDIMKISKNKISFMLYSIQSPPANRIAQIQVDDLKLKDGKAHFTFSDDGWGNAGEGNIEIISNKTIRISAEVTQMDETAMWDINVQKQDMTHAGNELLFDQ